jgi:hypothetical protein
VSPAQKIAGSARDFVAAGENGVEVEAFKVRGF